MHIVDILCWLAILGALGMVAFVGWACLVMASKSDDIAEEYWDEYWRKDDLKDESEGFLKTTEEAGQTNRKQDD